LIINRLNHLLNRWVAAVDIEINSEGIGFGERRRRQRRRKSLLEAVQVSHFNPFNPILIHLLMKYVI